MHKILDSTWRTGNMGCFGIVAVERVDGWKAYLGRADYTNATAIVDFGDETEMKDAQHIADAGAPLMEPEARAFFPQLKDIPYAY